jgi:hypothetical protein
MSKAAAEAATAGVSEACAMPDAAARGEQTPGHHAF